MPRDILICPTPSEMQLLKQKADEYGMTVDEFVQYLLQKSLTQTDTSIRHIVKN